MSPKPEGVGWQGGDSEELQVMSEDHLLTKSWRSVFVLLRSSTDWMRPTHIMDVHQFKCESHPENAFTETARKMFDQISEHRMGQLDTSN